MSKPFTKFSQWFDHRLIIGPYPGPGLKNWHVRDFHYVINVSGEFYPGEAPMYRNTNYFWLPMSEQKKDMGVNCIFGASVVLWQAELDNAYVYLHCHSGSNRSRTVQAAYYYLRTGTHLIDPGKSGKYLNKLLANCGRGYLPPQAEMEGFLKQIRDALNNGGIGPETLTMAKIECINNF